MAKELGFDIYDENLAGGHYAPLLRHDDELYLSGLVPRMNGKIQYPGRVGLELPIWRTLKKAAISARYTRSGDDPLALSVHRILSKVTRFVSPFM